MEAVSYRWWGIFRGRVPHGQGGVQEQEALRIKVWQNDGLATKSRFLGWEWHGSKHQQRTPHSQTPHDTNRCQSGVKVFQHKYTKQHSRCPLGELIDCKYSQYSISYRNTVHSAESALYSRGRGLKLEETILLEEIERHGFSSRSRGHSRCTPRSRCEVLGKMPISISQMVSPSNHCRDVRD